MTNTSATNFRQNAFAYFDRAVMFGDVIHVNTKHGSAIVMSEADYSAMVETLFLTSIPGMTGSILASREEKTEDCQPFDPSEAVKDREAIIQAGYGKRVKAMLELIAADPYKTPPPCERLVGDLKGFYSRRINLQHRLVYEVREAEKAVVIAGMRSYGA